MHLFDQVFYAVEFLFAAQPRNEIYMNILAVYILIKIEYVHFEQRFRYFERWLGANTGDGIQRTPVPAGHADLEYSHKA